LRANLRANRRAMHGADHQPIFHAVLSLLKTRSPLWANVRGGLMVSRPRKQEVRYIVGMKLEPLARTLARALRRRSGPP